MSADPKDFGPLFRHANPQPRAERPLFVSGARRPRYQLTLEGSRDNRMDIHKLRMILKRLLRDDKLRCIEVREI